MADLCGGCGANRVRTVHPACVTKLRITRPQVVYFMGQCPEKYEGTTIHRPCTRYALNTHGQL